MTGIDYGFRNLEKKRSKKKLRFGAFLMVQGLAYLLVTYTLVFAVKVELFMSYEAQ